MTRELSVRNMNQNQRKTKIFSMMMLVERRHRKFRVSMRPPSPTCLHTHMLNLATNTKSRDTIHDVHLFVNLGNISFKCLHLSSSLVNIRVVPMDRNLPDRKTLNKTMLRTLFRRFRNRQEMYP